MYNIFLVDIQIYQPEWKVSIQKTFYKGKWQQKFNSSHLKEIQKQCIEVYYKIYTSVRKILSPKSTNCPPF